MKQKHLIILCRFFGILGKLDIQYSEVANLKVIHLLLSKIRLVSFDSSEHYKIRSLTYFKISSINHLRYTFFINAFLVYNRVIIIMTFYFNYLTAHVIV